MSWFHPKPKPRPVPPPIPERPVHVSVRQDGELFLADGCALEYDGMVPPTGGTINAADHNRLYFTLPTYASYGWHATLVVRRDGQEHRLDVTLAPDIDVALPPKKVLRPRLSLQELARVRGAMWTQRLNLPMGPYPGSDRNILAMDFYEWYGPDDRKRMIEKTLAGGFTHAVTGPFFDAGGYHGRWPTQTELSMARWEWYLQAMQEWEDAGITPVHFVKPDNWTLAQTQDGLQRFYELEDSKRLLPIKVPAGWEPWRYEASSRTWGLFMDWMSAVDNNESLILAHSVTDVDALVGTDALYDDNGKGNDAAWQYLAPKIHGWLIQFGGYGNATDAGQAMAGQMLVDWRQNLAEYFKDADRRFRHGKAGWPTGSKFGPSVPLKLYYGEGGSYSFFNDPNIPESLVAEFGDIALANGADGTLDSCSRGARVP